MTQPPYDEPPIWSPPTGPGTDPVVPPEQWKIKDGVWWAIAFLVALVAAILFVVWAGSGNGGGHLLTPRPAATPAATFTVNGTLTLSDTTGYGILTQGTGCTGAGGYSDLLESTQVTVTDDTGRTVALGTLAAGQSVGTDCQFPFTIPDVPTGKGFYGIEVSHRGVVKFAEAKLNSPVELAIGY